MKTHKLAIGACCNVRLLRRLRVLVIPMRVRAQLIAPDPWWDASVAVTEGRTRRRLDRIVEQSVGAEPHAGPAIFGWGIVGLVVGVAAVRLVGWFLGG